MSVIEHAKSKRGREREELMGREKEKGGATLPAEPNTKSEQCVWLSSTHRHTYRAAG